MSCPTCHADLPSSTRFCPGCGSPGQVAVETRAIDLAALDAVGDTAAATDPYPEDSDPSSQRPAGRGQKSAGTPLAGATAVIPAPSEPPAAAGPSIGERLAPAADVARDRASAWARRFGEAPVEVRVAAVGSLVTVVSFLLFPYAAGSGAAVEVSGQLWWRPIAAVVATVLLVASLQRPPGPANAGEVPRRTDGLLASVVIAAAGVAEAGLLGLLAGDVARPRVGFYGMLLGLVVVLVAAVRGARRTLR